MLSRFVASQETNPWYPWLAMTLCSSLQFSLQGLLAILSEPLRRELGLTTTQISVASSALFISYVAMQIPAGLAFDRFRFHHTAGASMLVIALGTTITATAQSYPGLILARVLTGLGAPFAFIGLLHGVGSWFRNEYFASIISVSEFLGMVGVASINVCISRLTQEIGWRTTLTTVSFVLYGLAGLTFLLGDRTSNPKLHEKKRDLNEDWRQVKKAARSMFEDPTLRSSIFAGCSLFSVLTVFSGMWAVPFVESVYGYSLVQSTSIVSFSHIGLACASPVVGLLTRQFSPAGLQALGTIIATVFASTVFFLHVPSCLGFLIFCLGSSCSVFQLSFAILNNRCQDSSRGAAMAIANICMLGTAALVQLGTGTLLEFLSASEIKEIRPEKGSLLILMLLLMLAILSSQAAYRSYRMNKHN